MTAITGGTAAADTRIPNGHLLIEFAEAVAGSDDDRLQRARAAVQTGMGASALVDSAGIVGFFNAIDRVADSTGTPLDAKTAADTESLRRNLGIDAFAAVKAGLE